MNRFELGSNLLRNALIDSRSRNRFDGKFGGLPRFRYHFSKRCNYAHITSITMRPQHEEELRLKWGLALRKINGQKENHPSTAWFVGKLLSTTTLCIVNYVQRTVYLDVYRNDDLHAEALIALAVQNGTFGDWTHQTPIEATASA
tara:strand:+ start:936 stop:1370 length:435 start_codon:yes stop_codon:yes gene_type:complete